MAMILLSSLKTYKTIFAAFVILLLTAPSLQSVKAQQGRNLVVNGDMEGGFSARDGVTGVPLGWAFYTVSGSPDADRKAFAPHAFSDPTSWAIRDTYSTWVAGGYQTIQAVPGIRYLMGAHAFVWTCNDNQYSCIPPDAPRFSHTESNARVRIGIDPNSGTDPTISEIIWSPWQQAFDGYYGIQVEAVATGDYVTIFLQGDSGSAMAFNEVYWDDVSLTAISNEPVEDPVTANNPNAGTGQVAAPPPAPIVSEVPFVSPQQARTDGSVVHIVQSGDTFYSIVAAYSPIGATREQVMALNGWRYEPDYINIGDEIVILPPGSVDPSTGQLTGAVAAQPNPPATNANPAQQPAQAPQNAVTLAQAASPAAAESLRVLTATEYAVIPAVETISPFVP